MFLFWLDIIRIVSVSLIVFFGYQIGFASAQYDPVSQLHIMIPGIIVAIAGLSGIEGLLFGKKSAALKGFKSDGNYQRQSAFALLSYAAIALGVYLLNWGIKAELTILFAFLFFFILSAINHGLDAIRRQNYKWQNVNRPFITLLLIAVLVYPVVKVLQSF